MPSVKFLILTAVIAIVPSAAIVGFDKLTAGCVCEPGWIMVPNEIRGTEYAVRSVRNRHNVEYVNPYVWSPGEVDETQWRVLLDRGFLVSKPRNPLSPREVATTIVEVTEAGDNGSNIRPSTAGWVWNSTDHMFYATLPEDGLDAWARANKRRFETQSFRAAGTWALWVLAFAVTAWLFSQLPRLVGAQPPPT